VISVERDVPVVRHGLPADGETIVCAFGLLPSPALGRWHHVMLTKAKHMLRSCTICERERVRAAEVIAFTLLREEPNGVLQ
jgi:hypothetical protein